MASGGFAAAAGFNDADVNAQGAILKTQFQSPNYRPGVRGWAIFKNGNVEFNDGVFRGIVQAGTFEGMDFIINSAGIFLYSGTPAKGNLIFAITNQSGTDAVGNAYLPLLNAGVWSAVTGAQLAHMGLDSNGNVYLGNAAQLITIYMSPTNELIEFIPLGLGNGPPAISLASVAGTDQAGNDNPAGIALSALPLLVYSASPPALGNLMVSAAPVSGSDTFGNTFDQGIDIYTPGAVQVKGTSGQKIVLELSSGSPLIGWLTGVTEEGIAATAQAVISNAGPSEVMTLAIFGAEGSVHNDRVAIGMNSAAKDNSSTANGTLSYTKAGGAAANVATWGIKGMKVFSSISGDGNTYQPERLTAGQLAPITINQNTFSQQIVQTLTPGVGKYKVSGQICYTPNQAAGAAEFSFGGGGGLTVSTMHIIFKEFATGNPSALDSVADLNGFAGVFTGAVFGVAERITEFCGTVTFSAAGTLGLFAATTVPADTYTIEAEGSFIEMFPIGP
jgi:hypothetical protein